MRSRFAVLVALVGVALVIASVVFYNATKFDDDGTYGRVSLPGQQTLSLPAGQVDITFTEDLVNQVVAIPEFGLTVYPAPDGPTVPVHFHDRGPQGVNGVTHAPVGTVSVPRPGRYVVRVSGTQVGLGQQIGFGRLHAHHWALTVGIPVGTVLVLLGLAGPGSPDGCRAGCRAGQGPARTMTGSTRRYRRAA